MTTTITLYVRNHDLLTAVVQQASEMDSIDTDDAPIDHCVTDIVAMTTHDFENATLTDGYGWSKGKDKGFHMFTFKVHP